MHYCLCRQASELVVEEKPAIPDTQDAQRDVVLDPDSLTEKTGNLAVDPEALATGGEVKDTGSEVKDTVIEVKDTGSEVKDTEKEVKDNGSEVKDTGSAAVKDTGSEVKDVESEGKEDVDIVAPEKDEDMASFDEWKKQKLAEQAEQEKSKQMEGERITRSY